MVTNKQLRMITEAHALYAKADKLDKRMQKLNCDTESGELKWLELEERCDRLEGRADRLLRAALLELVGNNLALVR